MVVGPSMTAAGGVAGLVEPGHLDLRGLLRDHLRQVGPGAEHSGAGLLVRRVPAGGQGEDPAAHREVRHPLAANRLAGLGVGHATTLHDPGAVVADPDLTDLVGVLPARLLRQSGHQLGDQVGPGAVVGQEVVDPDLAGAVPDSDRRGQQPGACLATLQQAEQLAGRLPDLPLGRHISVDGHPDVTVWQRQHRPLRVLPEVPDPGDGDGAQSFALRHRRTPG